MREKSRKSLKPASFTQALALLSLMSQLEQAQAAQFEPQGKALTALLGTPKVFKKAVPGEGGQTTEFYYSKNASGKASRVAVIERGIYEPNCTHTWAIGMDATSGKVIQIRVIEMSCPHAFPTRAASFLDQYKGKGPANLAKLDGDIQTIAKATGSSVLTTDAVKRAVTTYWKNKGSF